MYSYHFMMLLAFLTCFIQDVLAEYCGENIFCHSPYRCCQVAKGCCYDSTLHTNRHLRLQIWNMWYFWFLIIFMMMSCFGGCGYYRRRRLAMMARGNQNVNRSIAVMTSQRRSDRGPMDRTRPVDAFTYTGPGAILSVPATNLPPAYSEVVSQPGLYPINKSELPPYPGDKPMNTVQGIPMSAFGGPPDENCLPPPYSEHPPEEPAVASPRQISQRVNEGPVESVPLPINVSNQNEPGAREETDQ